MPEFDEDDLVHEDHEPDHDPEPLTPEEQVVVDEGRDDG